VREGERKGKEREMEKQGRKRRGGKRKGKEGDMCYGSMFLF